MTNVADLLAAAARDEADAAALARWCAEAGGDVDAMNRALQPIETEGRRFPFEPPHASGYADTYAGDLQYRADLASARLHYLEGRASVLRERQAFRERLVAPVLPDLDGVVDAIRDDPASVAEVATENARQRVDAIQRGRESERQRLREEAGRGEPR